MLSRRSAHRIATLGPLCLTLCLPLCFGGCGNQSEAPAPAPVAPAPAPATAQGVQTPTTSIGAATTPETVSTRAASNLTATAAKDEVKIMKEYWEGTRVLKFSYEMRRGADGRWDRNGMSQAYYATGKLEREGPYKGGKRVGMWTYYDEQGKVLRTENRGGATGAPASGGASRNEQSDHAHDGPHDGHDH